MLPRSEQTLWKNSLRHFDLNWKNLLANTRLVCYLFCHFVLPFIFIFLIVLLVIFRVARTIFICVSWSCAIGFCFCFVFGIKVPIHSLPFFLVAILANYNGMILSSQIPSHHILMKIVDWMDLSPLRSIRCSKGVSLTLAFYIMCMLHLILWKHRHFQRVSSIHRVRECE